MMTVYICAEDHAENTTLVLRIATGLPEDELRAAVKAASREFVNSPDATVALSATAGHFNWSDAALWLPVAIQKKHGFEILDAAPAVSRVDHDESLVD